MDVTGHFLQPFQRNLAQEILQDHKTRRQHMGLAHVRKGIPGRETLEIRAWVGAGEAPQDQNHRKLGLADTGCDRNNSDLQNAGTLIQLQGPHRAYERERSVKIFALFSHRSASQALPRSILVPGFCKSESKILRHLMQQKGLLDFSNTMSTFWRAALLHPSEINSCRVIYKSETVM